MLKANGTPYNIAGTNGICIPVGNCHSDIDAAQQKTRQTANGMQFNGALKDAVMPTAAQANKPYLKRPARNNLIYPFSYIDNYKSRMLRRSISTS